MGIPALVSQISKFYLSKNIDSTMEFENDSDDDWRIPTFTTAPLEEDVDENIRFRASHPISQAVAVLGGTPYSYFRYETHLASLNGLSVYDDIAATFAKELRPQPRGSGNLPH